VFNLPEEKGQGLLNFKRDYTEISANITILLKHVASVLTDRYSAAISYLLRALGPTNYHNSF
jgi:hypothetical protein